MTLYLDMDGVLANFDKACGKALGTDNTYKWEFIHGSDKFWEIINRNKGFWDGMEPMPDVHVLMDEVEELNPVILTALPKVGADDVIRAKTAWIRNFMGDNEVITCQTHEKAKYCQPGDILVDDRAVNEKRWRDKGGHFILHRDAMSTISILKDLKVI